MINWKFPDKTYSNEEIKNWTLYEHYLINYPIINRFLGHILKEWIERLDNPFAIKWIRNLMESKLDKLEMTFSIINRNNNSLLQKIVKELSEEKSKEDQLISKIISLNSELLAYNYLVQKCPNIEPLGEVGDFKCGDNIIVSVKDKRDENFNIEIIENYIQGLFYLKDYDLLKKYCINFETSGGVTYDIRAATLEFLKKSLISLINRLPVLQNKYDSGSSIKGNLEKGITFTINKYSNARTQNQEIEIILKKKSTLRIILSLDNHFHVYYPNEQVYHFANIRNSIDDFIKEFDKRSIAEKDFTFWGWINIATSFSNENGLLSDREKLIKMFSSRCANKKYKIIFCFYPYSLNFDMKGPVIFEFN